MSNHLISGHLAGNYQISLAEKLHPLAKVILVYIVAPALEWLTWKHGWIMNRSGDPQKNLEWLVNNAPWTLSAGCQFYANEGRRFTMHKNKELLLDNIANIRDSWVEITLAAGNYDGACYIMRCLSS